MLKEYEDRSFLLVPDSSAARRIRRVLAMGKPRFGVLVGTWLELIELAADAYLLPKSTDNWDGGFKKLLESKSDSFWSESYAISPQETADVIEKSLFQVEQPSPARRVRQYHRRHRHCDRQRRRRHCDG